MQATRVGSLVPEDSTCLRTTKPHEMKSMRPHSVLHNVKPTLCIKAYPLLAATRENHALSHQDPTGPKLNFLKRILKKKNPSQKEISNSHRTSAHSLRQKFLETQEEDQAILSGLQCHPPTPAVLPPRRHGQHPRHRASSLSLAAEMTHRHSLRPQKALGAASSHSSPQVTLACVFTLEPVLLQADSQGTRLSPHQSPCHSAELWGGVRRCEL